ncbi:MAG: MotA/TolQ/ExbB proton channel family protein [Gammaproteobacteria bacterium]
MRNIEHLLVLAWLLTAGLVLFGTWVVVDQGLMRDLLQTDRSHVSALLIAMYAAGAAHSLARTWHLSVELGRAAQAERLVSQAKAGPFRLVDGRVITPAGAALPPGFVSGYIADLALARIGGGRDPRPGEAGGDLLEACAARLRGSHEFGWFLIDLMLKIGFLGTLIGFIWMLASVAQHPVIDASTMQVILRDMSHGMSIALNTTLTSLVTGTLLSFPYYLLGRGLDELIECTVRIAQVEVLPRLAAA